MAKPKNQKSDYCVGYGKPPAQSRFKKGQSGNPAGRPKGRLNLITVLEQALNVKVVVNEGGRRKIKSKLGVAITQAVNKAAGGDLKALQVILDLMPILDPTDTSTTAAPDLAADREMALRVADRLAASPLKKPKDSDE